MQKWLHLVLTSSVGINRKPVFPQLCNVHGQDVCQVVCYKSNPVFLKHIKYNNTHFFPF